MYVQIVMLCFHWHACDFVIYIYIYIYDGDLWLYGLFVSQFLCSPHKKKHIHY